MTMPDIQEQPVSNPNIMIQKGLTAALPIMLGYLPVAITYGVLAKQSGLSLVELTLMSAFVYAGASQFMGVNMLAVGAGSIEIIVATFILNVRHFVMSLSFMNRLREIKLKWKAPLTLGLTDETFAVASFHKKEAQMENGVLFYTVLFILSYISWVGGSFLGGVLGEIVPDPLSQSMGIALYAMFIGLLIPTVKKEVKVGLIAVIAMLIHTLCSEVLQLSAGWSIVIGTILGGFFGVFIFEEEEQS
ncbi:MAG TPA: AzlC family ABC transporter permease [Bacillota bacterium]|nr:AzlC family ABC transporter permease [Bacillota bacterium]